MDRNKEDKVYSRIEGVLYSYKKTVVEIKLLELEIERIQNDYAGAGAVLLSEKVSSTNKISSRVEDEAIDRENHLDGLCKEKRSKEIEVEKIDNILSLLNDEEYRLIELRYFRTLSFKEIGERMAEDEKNLIKKRGKIIKTKLIPIFKIITH